MRLAVPNRFSRLLAGAVVAAFVASCAQTPAPAPVAVDQSWPVVDERMNPANRQCVQVLLNSLGYAAGPADGVIGPATRTAIMDYQGAAGVRRDGVLSRTLLASLSSYGDRRLCGRRTREAAPVTIAARTPATAPVRARAPATTRPPVAVATPTSPPVVAPPPTTTSPPVFVRRGTEPDSPDSGSW